jgi:hypothetical protein
VEKDMDKTDWVTLHQKRLKEAYLNAKRNLEKECSQRKAKVDVKIQPHELEIGKKVLLKDHSVMGRNKIGDYYRPETYEVIDLHGPVYTFQAEGKTWKRKVVNRREIMLGMCTLHHHSFVIAFIQTKAPTATLFIYLDQC